MTMPSHWHLGNDIVDLTDPRHAGKASDHRFLARVFSEAETVQIRATENQDRALWARWAGKEAAFKTISKFQGGPPVFVHPTFEVTLFAPDGPADDPPMTHFGQVRYESFLLPLRIEVVGNALHAVTWIPDAGHAFPRFTWDSQQTTASNDGWKKLLEPSFSPREWSCVSHRHSALARLAARRSMAQTLGVEETELEVGCGPGKPGRRIPKVFHRGKEVPLDLTLSHHGRLLAWAYLIPPGI
ncbi:MAG: 4'-phosphopantetheinyl transferase superfamily protein [Gemmatimonadota bacterium]|jgi:phosphopantetheine--protein transferase-like protein